MMATLDADAVEEMPAEIECFDHRRTMLGPQVGPEVGPEVKTARLWALRQNKGAGRAPGEESLPQQRWKKRPC